VSNQPETAKLQTYRAISPWAPLALLLGLASPLALVHPLLWLVPLAGVWVAWMGFKQISSDSGYAGRPALLGALALALLFGSMAPARYLTRHWMISREANRLAVQWIGMIRQGDLQQAHQWTLPPTERAGPEASLQLFYESSASSLAGLNRLQSHQDLQRFREALAEGDARVVTHRIATHDQGDVVVLDCSPSHLAGASRDKATIRISMRRELMADSGKVFWRVVMPNPQ